MIVPAAKLDHVSEETIRLLVDSFYAKVRRDPKLGPIFLRAIPGDWQPHLTKMYAFWSSVMLTTGRYKGNPMLAHLRLKSIEESMFPRWLALFHETAEELFSPELAASFRLKSERIAESLKLGLFYRPALGLTIAPRGAT